MHEIGNIRVLNSKQENNTMDTELNQQLIEIFQNGGRVIITPISKNTKNKARKDFDEEMCIISKGELGQWDSDWRAKPVDVSTQYKRKTREAKDGDVLVFVHQDKKDTNGGHCEYFQIIRTSDKDRRPWWDPLTKPRTTLFFAPKSIGTSTVRELCENIIKFSFKDGATHGNAATRFAGTRMYQWNDKFLADVPNVLPASVFDIPELELLIEDESIIVYAVRNNAWPDLVKIGKTANMDKRLKALNGTNIPKAYQYKVEQTLKTKNTSKLESEIHGFFDEYRDTKDREFFKITPNTVEKFFNILKKVSNQYS